MTPMEMSKSSPYRFVLETILFLTYAVFGLSWIAVTPLMADIQAEFHMTGAELGMLNTTVSLAKVVAPMLAGALAVRIGLKKTILLGSICISCAVLVPFAKHSPEFLASRFLFGIGGAIVVTLLGAVVMSWFPKGEVPVVNAFNNVAVNTGITMTLFTTPPLSAWLGWRNTLLLYGLLSVVLTLLWWIFGRDSPPQDSSTDPSRRNRQVRYPTVWRMTETWLIALSFSGPLALYLAFNTWLPSYYVEALEMSRATAARYTGLFNLIGIPTAIAAGFLTRRLGLRRPFIIGSGVVMGFAAFGMLLGREPVWIGASAVLLGISLFAYVAPLFTIPMELKGMTSEHVILIMGTVFSFAYLVSAISQVSVCMIHYAAGSFLPGLAIWAAFSWVLAVGGFFLPETGPARIG